MINSSLIIDGVNNFLKKSQDSCAYLYENSFFAKNIENIIYAFILGVFILSTFASSDTIGYAALTTLFLTVLKLFVKKGEKLEVNLFEVFLIIYFLIVVVSLFGSTLFHLSLKGFFKTFTYLGFYFSAVQYFKNNLNRIAPTVLVIAVCAFSQGIIGILQNFSQVEEISTWQDVSAINPEDVLTRVYGSLKPFNPNLFGGYLVAAIPCILGSFFYFLYEKKYHFAAVSLFAAIITLGSIVQSGCRGAYIGVFAIFATIFSIFAKFVWQKGSEKLKQTFLTISGSIVAASTALALLIHPVRTRIFSIFVMRQDSSTSFRFNVYQSAINMIKDNWLLGIGIGNQNFREIYGLYMRTGFDALSAYSIYLELAVESGIFALLSFLAFLGALILKSFKFIFANKDVKNTLMVATAVVSIIAVMIHGFVDTIFFRPQVQFIFWTMVAFVSALTGEEK